MLTHTYQLQRDIKKVLLLKDYGALVVTIKIIAISLVYPGSLNAGEKNRAWYQLFAHALKIILTRYAPTLFDTPPHFNFDFTRCFMLLDEDRSNIINSIFEALGRTAQHDSETSNDC